MRIRRPAIVEIRRISRWAFLNSLLALLILGFAVAQEGKDIDRIVETSARIVSEHGGIMEVTAASQSGPHLILT